MLTANLKKLSAGKSLSSAETRSLFEKITSSESDAATDAEIGAYLFATSIRTPDADELVGAAEALLGAVLPLKTHVTDILDTCGTGGSGLQSFNTSTVVAFLLAADGQPVAKHGNRAATSKCGSADLLEALGIKIDLPPERSAKCLEKTNFCFLFAPYYHAATKRVSLIRKQLGFRTIFNALGPLVSPARPAFQVLGVSSRELLSPVAKALKTLGTKKALVVCGEDGLDEITLSARTDVIEISPAGVREYTISPEDFGFSKASHAEVSGGNPEENAERVSAILHGEKSPYRDIILLNAGAAFYVSGKARSIPEGIEKAEAVLESDAPKELLKSLVTETSK